MAYFSCLSYLSGSSHSMEERRGFAYFVFLSAFVVVGWLQIRMSEVADLFGGG